MQFNRNLTVLQKRAADIAHSLRYQGVECTALPRNTLSTGLRDHERPSAPPPSDGVDFVPGYRPDSCGNTR